MVLFILLQNLVQCSVSMCTHKSEVNSCTHTRTVLYFSLHIYNLNNRKKKMLKGTKAFNLIFNTQYFVHYPKSSPALKNYFLAMYINLHIFMCPFTIIYLQCQIESATAILRVFSFTVHGSSLTKSDNFRRQKCSSQTYKICFLGLQLQIKVRCFAQKNGVLCSYFFTYKWVNLQMSCSADVLVLPVPHGSFGSLNVFFSQCNVKRWQR